MDIEIPRDRNGGFEPQVAKKNHRDVSADIEVKVISMHAKGMTTRSILGHLKDIYGTVAYAEMISKRTDRVLRKVKAWLSRPLAQYT